MYASLLREFGEATVLQGADLPAPEPRPGWVDVRLRTGGLNWHDVLVRRGLYHSPLPHVLGADGAGVCADTGDEVVVLPSLDWGPREAAPGPDWQILGDTTRGTYSEVVQVPAASLYPRPAAWGWAASGVAALTAVTAYRALVAKGRLRSGESLLVLGAGGGLSATAIPLANAVGAEVYVTSSRDDRIEHATELGARAGVLYTDPDWPAHARSMSPQGAGFDVVLDAVGAVEDAVRVLRPGGRLVVLGASRAESATVVLRPFYFGQFELIGSTMGSPADFAGYLALADEHHLDPPPIDSSFGLDRAAEAHARLESGDALGKVALEIA